MYQEGGKLVLSASDLVGFLACDHLATLEHAVARRERDAPTETDPELRVLFTRGLEHENAYLQGLERQGLQVASIDGKLDTLGDLLRLQDETLSAMRAGADVIYQAAFLSTGDESRAAWRGHADFLRRITSPSDPGPSRYEPEDTKLARHVKPGAVVQLCHYAEHVARLQDEEPENIHVVLGGQERVSLRLRDFTAYYRAAKGRFEGALAGGARETYPDPCSHCAICRWQGVCDARREADDHLSLVAGLSREQVRKLVKAGIPTVSALAASPETAHVPRIAHGTLDRLRSQALLQVRARERPEGAPPPYELLKPEPARGLAQLPEPSPGDLYFDIEGDPYVRDGGLEYLLGAGWVEEGTFRYAAFWGHDGAEEKRAFEAFIDFVMKRWERWPDLHIYHYAAYETTALGKLMGRHGAREPEVDALLRGRVLVDLYQVVRQALRVGTPSYSIKKLEPLYMGAREAAIAEGTASIVEYERWLQCQDPTILEALEQYNREDCESTWLLRDWLESRRTDAEEQFGESIGRRALGDPAPSEKLAEVEADVASIAEALLADLEGTPDAATEGAAPARWLLAQLLEWHRREAKPEYWQYFRRILDLADRDLFEDSEAVAGLEYEGPIGSEARSTIHRYRFDPGQEHKLRVGDTACDPARERARILYERKVPGPGTLVALDPVAGTLDLKRGNQSKADHPSALIPGGPIGTGSLREAVRSVARSVVASGIGGDGPFRAARDLLLRNPPRITGRTPGTSLRLLGEDPMQAAIRLVSSLDESCLAIQGPPGTGKTFTGASVIAELIAVGHRVGITAQSHAVIGEMLCKVMDHARRLGLTIRAIQKVDAGKGSGDSGVQHTRSNEDVEAALAADEVDLVAGTTWLFSRNAFRGALDYIVVDEAGQLSLANVVAVASSARNLVLIGDPQQLAQPSPLVARPSTSYAS